MRTEEFLRFAKSYLSDAFPKPQRIDCPPHSDLTPTPEHPRDADPTISRAQDRLGQLMQTVP